MEDRIVRIAVPSPLYRTFDYRVPAAYGPLLPGMRIQVPFGRGRQVGVLLEARADSPVEKLRPIEAVLDREPILPPDLLALSLWAQRYYHHPPGEVFATLLPALLRRKAAIRSNPCWRITPAGRQALQDGLRRRAARQQALLACLAEQADGVPGAQLRRELPGCGRVLRALAQQGWVELLAAGEMVASSFTVDEWPATGTAAYAGVRTTAQAPPLNPAQAQAVAAVTVALGSFGVFLLDGVTGSGKTEVYLQLVEAALARGRQALVIVPEIGLTPQLLGRFAARLSAPLAALHSGLGDRERLNAWLAARNGQVAVVIGTRSAVFTPLAKPGVIVIDEEHDLSLKQQEGFRYHARDLAVMRARQLNIPVVLGSATPSLESLLNVRRGRYHYLRLPQRAGAAVEPTVEIIDLRAQPLTEGLSRPLLGAMRAHLAQGGQALLFLNRRGFAPTLICHECGWLSQCRHCDARLTLHLQRRRQICHHCGAALPLPIACPECGSVDLRALGQGTERIEQALQQEFPAAGIARIDRDSTRRKGSLQALLEDVQRGERRILIGTQMLAKGHHFPDVTLVGVVNADHGLFGADFRASERMAQLILQVAGRAGRAEKPGVVLIQTHYPNHPLLRTLVTQGYSAFAEAALTERQAARLPPFTWQALLRADALDPESPQQFLTEALELGRRQASPVELLGPAPAPMERRAGRYRAQLLAQAEQRQQLHAFLDSWVEQLGSLKTARKVRWSLDVDPQDLF